MSSVHLPSAVSIPTETDHGEPELAASRRWFEILAITFVVPLGVACLNPDDPLLMRGNFPWLVLVPLLIGVQHGALAALASSSLTTVLGGCYVAYLGQLELGGFGAWAGGCVAVGVIAGYFCDRTRARLAQLTRQVAVDAQHLSRLSRAHAVVKMSHQKLEERLCAESWSLGSAIEDTRRELAGTNTLSAMCERILSVLGNHALVQSASLLTTLSAGKLNGTAAFEFATAARLGNPPPVDPGHRLVQRALATGRLVALDVESHDGADETILAVIPLCTANGTQLGLVVIHEMPFMAFQADNLKSLATLTAHLGDLLEDRLLEARGGEREGEGAESGPVSSADQFVGTRTGIHRRSSLAQSA